jgi:hypothetical protein
VLRMIRQLGAKIPKDPRQSLQSDVCHGSRVVPFPAACGAGCLANQLRR